MLLEIAPFSLDTLLFKVASAFATVGLSTGMPRRGCRARAMAALWGASSHVPSHGSNRVTKASGTSQDGLYKTELIKPRGPWKTVDDVEIATAEWVDWFNHRSLYQYCGDIPPATLEAAYYAYTSLTPAG